MVLNGICVTFVRPQAPAGTFGKPIVVNAGATTAKGTSTCDDYDGTHLACT